jgi:hypothetical protein
VKQAYEAQEEFRKPNGEKVILENIIPLHENETKKFPKNMNAHFYQKNFGFQQLENFALLCSLII